MKHHSTSFKSIVIILAGLFGMIRNAYSQQPEQDCISAIPICQNQYATQQSYVGGGNNPNEIDSTTSCLLNGEKNDVWYTFTVQTSGNLSFVISPNDPLNDYDWAVFNLTGANCSSIFSNPSLSISCNYSSDPGNTGPTGATGLTNATSTDPHYNAVIPVLAGQTYVINLSNWSSTQSGYSIDFSSSTAQIFDNVAPQLATVIAPSSCGSSTLSFNFSENIVFSSVQNTDFTLTGPGGTYILNGWSSPSQVLGSTYGNGFTINVSPAMSSGNYTFNLVNTSGSVTDLCGNVALPSAFNFTVSGISASVTTTDVLCNGDQNGSAQANANSGTAPFSFTWSNGSVGSPVCTSLAAGIYTVTVTDANGCSSTQSATILEPSAMSLTEIHSGVKCFGDANGSATVSVIGGTPAYTYAFSTQTGSSPTALNLSAGLNQVLVTDGNGCNASVQFTILQPSQVVSTIFSTVSDTICAGTQISLSAGVTGGTPGYTYNWNNGLYAEDSIIVKPFNTTDYTVLVTDANGCSSQLQSIRVIVYNAIRLITTTTAVCKGDLSELNVSATGGDGQYNFAFLPSGLTGNHFTLLPDTSITYIVTVTDGCQSAPAQDTVQFTVHPLPVSDFTMDITEGCAPLCINFTDNSTITSGSVSSWNWVLGDEFSSEQNPVNCFITKGNHKIKLVTVSDFGCIGDTVMQKIKVFAQPVALFSVDKEAKGVFHASFDFRDSSTNAVSWVWDFGDVNNPVIKTLKNPSHTYSDTGSYTVTLVVFNNHGCSDTITQVVEVFPVSKMFLPDAFSPNGDGVNDVFTLKGKYISAVDLTIFDRWGNSIYHLGNVNDSWDGTFNGNALPIGVYSYVADIQGADGKRLAQNGLITLVK